MSTGQRSELETVSSSFFIHQTDAVSRQLLPQLSNRSQLWFVTLLLFITDFFHTWQWHFLSQEIKTVIVNEWSVSGGLTSGLLLTFTQTPITSGCRLALSSSDWMFYNILCIENKLWFTFCILAPECLSAANHLTNLGLLIGITFYFHNLEAEQTDGSSWHEKQALNTTVSLISLLFTDINTICMHCMTLLYSFIENMTLITTLNGFLLQEFYLFYHLTMKVCLCCCRLSDIQDIKHPKGFRMTLKKRWRDNWYLS